MSEKGSAAVFSSMRVHNFESSKCGIYLSIVFYNDSPIPSKQAANRPVFALCREIMGGLRSYHGKEHFELRQGAECVGLVSWHYGEFSFFKFNGAA